MFSTTKSVRVRNAAPSAATRRLTNSSMAGHDDALADRAARPDFPAPTGTRVRRCAGAPFRSGGMSRLGDAGAVGPPGGSVECPWARGPTRIGRVRGRAGGRPGVPHRRVCVADVCAVAGDGERSA
jgi:hypothetical protein